MRGIPDDVLEEFLTARTHDLHHDAYLLTASDDDAEHLVALVLAELARERTDLTQAASAARHRMARAAAAADVLPPDDPADFPSRFRPLAALTSRQRAILTLESLDGHDLHSAAHALHLSPHQVQESYAGIPAQLTDADPADLRRLLEDFGDLAESPDPATALANLHAVPPPPRRPWWSYVAAVVIIAVTVASVWITQTWHHEWLRTATGLNHTHGTHFPAYTQGYKLVDIRDIEPGPDDDFAVSGSSAVTMMCTDLGANAGMAVSSDLTGGTYYRRHADCDPKSRRTALVSVTGTTVITIDDFSRDSWPVAIYRKVPLGQYPVATDDFDVQKGRSLDELRTMTSADGVQLRPRVKGTVLTLHGTSAHPNGTFTGTLRLPPPARGTDLNVVGLLSPTATGRYLVTIDHQVPWTTCGRNTTVTYEQLQRSDGCSLVDHRVPQIDFEQTGPSQESSATVPVQITVENARGPWTLQVVADRFSYGQQSTHGPTSVPTS